MGEALIRSERAGDGIAVLTLDDPPANTYSCEMMQQLDAAILDARMDADVHEMLLRGAARAVGFIKRAVISGAEGAFAESLALERELQQQLFESEDAREGIAANLEKRPPQFKGR